MVFEDFLDSVCRTCVRLRTDREPEIKEMAHNAIIKMENIQNECISTRLLPCKMTLLNDVAVIWTINRRPFQTFLHPPLLEVLCLRFGYPLLRRRHLQIRRGNCILRL
jgi:hypothetical protein